MPTRLTITTREVDTARPLVDLLPTDDAALWLRGDDGLVAWGTAVRWTAGTGPARFDRTADQLRALSDTAHLDDEVGVPGAGLAGFVSFTFDDGTAGSRLVVPRRIVGRRDGRTWLTRIDGPSLPDDVPGPATTAHAAPVRDRVRFAGSSMPDLHWLDAVAHAVKRIDAGDLEKVVLARDHAVWSKHPLDPRWLASRLTARFPDCFTFLVDGLLGATPELLVRRSGETVTSLALAGTAPRGASPDEDDDLGRALLESAKDQHEHALAARSVEAALAPVCTPLDRSAEPFLQRLDNLQHLATRIDGTLSDPSLTVLDLAARLHPTAAVGGTPRDVAVRMIRELEGMDRGRYAGPVGWCSPDGDGELGIALRCAELAGARARLFAGAGIVAGSLPEDELEETRVKLRAMQGALDA